MVSAKLAVYRPRQEGGFTHPRHQYVAMTRSHEWETPRGLFEDLHREFDFTIDLAADASNALLPRFYG